MKDSKFFIFAPTSNNKVQETENLIELYDNALINIRGLITDLSLRPFQEVRDEYLRQKNKKSNYLKRSNYKFNVVRSSGAMINTSWSVNLLHIYTS